MRLLPLCMTASLVMAVTTCFAWSQVPGAQQGMKGMGSPAPVDSATRSDADSALMASMEKMNHAMSEAPMTGHADADFVAMMIIHHQGALDMCAVEIKEGKDPALKTLCREIISDQTKEIKIMKEWQRRHPAMR